MQFGIHIKPHIHKSIASVAGVFAAGSKLFSGIVIQVNAHLADCGDVYIQIDPGRQHSIGRTDRPLVRVFHPGGRSRRRSVQVNKTDQGSAVPGSAYCRGQNLTILNAVVSGKIVPTTFVYGHLISVYSRNKGNMAQIVISFPPDCDGIGLRSRADGIAGSCRIVIPLNRISPRRKGDAQTLVGLLPGVPGTGNSCNAEYSLRIGIGIGSCACFFCESGQ